MIRRFLLVLALLTFPAFSDEVIIGDVRVQTLSETLLRVEFRGSSGFEDRATFNIVTREFPGIPISRKDAGDDVVLDTAKYRVIVPKDATTPQGISIETPDGRPLVTLVDEAPKMDFMPAPAKAKHGAWVMPDSPRVVPAPQGALPPANDDPTSGWDLSNDAYDVYIFLPGEGGHAQLRNDFLKLTGKTALPPLYTFGYWTSRWFEYTEESALKEIDTFKEKGIPLDLFVVDTDWRVGASHGYGVNTKLFPDMARFLAECRKRNIKTLFNDHPEPMAETALDPKELKYRQEGLTSLLNIGMDAWWFDRNWHTHLKEPAPGLRKETWGMRLYHDITQAARPNQRPLVMSNVDGIDNGKLNRNSLPAAHRYPIWWTGDTIANWKFYRAGVENGVNAGAIMLLPFVNEDCGGHVGSPSPELMVRFFQFGCFSPVLRPHTTKGGTRLPWDFGDEARQIMTDYAKLRYRLLPTIYSAARQAHEDGTPLMRRCDFYWPEYSEAEDASQYLFGDDLLVAPVLESATKASPIPSDHFVTPDGAPGLKAEYFANDKFEGEPAVTRIEAGVNLDCGKDAPADGLPVDGFSARWTGKLINIPETGEYDLGAIADDGVRIFLDGVKIVESWQGNDSVLFTAKVKLEKGRSYDLKIEYYDSQWDARLIASWTKPSDRREFASRSIWIPPGEWENLWTGERVTGPQSVQMPAPIHQLPMFARCGGLVLSIPQVMNTAEATWDKLIVDAWLPNADQSQTRVFYEDDGGSNDYLKGAFRKTNITLERKGDTAKLLISPAEGEFPGQVANREWTIRLHLPAGTTAEAVAGGEIKQLIPSSVPVKSPLPPLGTASVNATYEIQLPPERVTNAREVTIRLK